MPRLGHVVGKVAIFDQLTSKRVSSRLLGWFRRNQRDLPWRDNRDAYRIWVSEVMLQQTQVATVVPYFNKFVRRFPTLTSLASASEQDVLGLWEGLGYYRRARDLHRASRILLEQGHKQIPNDPDVVRELPGVGRYMLGAVLSQAFDCKMPILEANSERVLCRLLGERRNPRKASVRRRLWQTAEAMLPSRHVGDFNQALMELGALICTGSQPRCTQCPLRECCVATRNGLERAIPRRSERPNSTATRDVSVIVRRNRHVLIVRRPGTGRWAGLWEFPRGPIKSGESPAAAGRRMLAQLTSVAADLGKPHTVISHAVNHHRITLLCFEGRYRSGRFRSDFYVEGRWTDPVRLGEFPFSTPQRRIVRSLTENVGIK